MTQKFEEIEVNTGDIIITQGLGLLSKLIRLLISVRDGIPFAAAKSHVCHVISPLHCISATSTGVKLVTLNKIIGKSNWWIWRSCTDYPHGFMVMVMTLLGKKYSYPHYIIDATRIVGFCAMLLSPFFGWKLFITGIILYYLRKMKWLDKWDRRSFDCSESVLQIETDISRMTWEGLGDVRNASPNQIENILNNLSLYGEWYCANKGTSYGI